MCALCHDGCMSTYSVNVQRRHYRIGIDVGLKSIGFCAIEVDGRGTPTKLLNSTVHLHDGGAEPGDRKEVSRKKTAGIARRARRRGLRNKRRLRELDAYLSEELGWPLPDLEEFTDQHEPWQIRQNARRCSQLPLGISRGIVVGGTLIHLWHRWLGLLTRAKRSLQ